eukprot:gb/GECH01011358.1/.p1 GENE.gb/GECH01011358.1/~~gb/GECH01011358.1/.p1  ORF type:complete len:500 (+),score=103.19 gb/GECH01011358.1/:1-1500(+)
MNIFQYFLVVLIITTTLTFCKVDGTVANHTEEIDNIMNFLNTIETRIQNSIQDKNKGTNEAIKAIQNEVDSKKAAWDDAVESYTAAKTEANTRYTDAKATAQSNYEQALRDAENRYNEDMEQVEAKARTVNVSRAAYHEHQTYLQEETQRLQQDLDTFEKNLEEELALVEKVKNLLLKMQSRNYKKFNEKCSDTFRCQEGLECDTEKHVCLHPLHSSCSTDDECVNSRVCDAGQCKLEPGASCNQESECRTGFQCLDSKCQTAGHQVFTNNDNFEVPDGVREVRVLVVGGGGGGANGHQGGGGSGYVKSSTLDVSGKSSVPVTVGDGGSGALRHSSNNIEGNSPGGISSFGQLLSADGGKTSTDTNSAAADGGSGGGGSCNGGNDGGDGGSGGTDGGSCTYDGGHGQGSSFTQSLSIFVRNNFSAGSGGQGGTSSHSGGGGGGGVLMNGDGPKGEDGPKGYSAKGGQGYGGGGGAGGYESGHDRAAGGNGAHGMVYVEW